MQGSISSISQRDNFIPSKWDKFLWWLSTAESELIASCVVDRNRYRIIGMTVLATWSFATLAWTYFWVTITSNWYIPVALGLFMGFIILCIDRALIKGMNKFNKYKVAPLLFRSLLALTLGAFMAQPAILYMFDKEIKLQASLDNEARKRKKQSELDSLYLPRKSELNVNKAAIQKELQEKYNEVAKLKAQYIAEIDGTGGTGKVGIHNIARAKLAEYEKADQEYAGLLLDRQPKIAQIDSNLAIINNAIDNENKAYEGLLNNGFLTRIEALSNLVKNNSALQWRYILILVILMLIELMPVIAKTLLPSGTYDDKVRWVEEMEKETGRNNQIKETELKELYNKLAKENDAQFIQQFFNTTEARRKEKMKEKLDQWQQQEEISFDGFWETLKRQMLTKQEN